MSARIADFNEFLARAAEQRKADAAAKRERIRLVWRMRRGIYPSSGGELNPPIYFRNDGRLSTEAA